MRVSVLCGAYKWQLATIADPDSAEEIADDQFAVPGSRRVVWRRHLDEDRITVEDSAAILEAYDLDPADYLELPNPLANFWKHPVPLYHATTEDHVEAILEEGLRPRSLSRGLRNRGVGAAVFTTSDLEQTAMGTYGDVVFEIDTVTMARDGYTPTVAQEPDVVEAEGLNSLAWAFGLEDFNAEPENDPSTVIVEGAIPPEYLRRLDG